MNRADRLVGRVAVIAVELQEASTDAERVDMIARARFVLAELERAVEGETTTVTP